MRYRLIPACGRNSLTHVVGDLEQARACAEDLALELGMGVVVCEAPLDGIVRCVLTVPGPEPAKSRGSRVSEETRG